MKFYKLDLFLLLFVIVISSTVYIFFREEVPTNYLIPIIFLFGLLIGISTRVLSKNKK
ncbi:hypothetical protein JOC74_003340 [Bacillus capparidis]|uniref:Uncharacterized protein n=1 Tax=Bacillus capparidis TaxID=1840411 RepID=A0ABS4CZN3_9BACI|nr:hypothetical protein [Bacillus capparidis]